MLRKASGALQPTTCHSQALSQRASRSCRTRSGLVTPPRTIAPLGPPGLEAGEQFVGRDNRVDLAAQSSGAICALSVFTSGLAGTAEPTIVLWPACLAPFDQPLTVSHRSPKAEGRLRRRRWRQLRKPQDDATSARRRLERMPRFAPLI